MTPVRTIVRRVACHKRGQILVLVGLIFVLTGWIQQDSAPAFSRTPVAALSYSAQLSIMPLEAWGWTFVGAGVVACAAALAGAVHQWIAFGILQALSLFWGSLFVASWIDTGYGRAWVGALTWITVSGVLLIVAGWEDPPSNGRGVCT